MKKVHSTDASTAVIDRMIVFTDNKVLTCLEYGYQYAYRPTAVILAKPFTYQGNTGYDYKMVVEEEIYDMRR